jgi:myo-inositol-1(or 4)-monophosphatase
MSAPTQPPEFLPLAREAASAAASVLLTERPFVIAEGASATKSSVSDPVTRADVAAQQVIADMITRARPGDAIFGEEGLDRPGDSGWRWIVDPLDGTVNYLYGRDEWSVSIAVEDPDGAVVVGVVLAPVPGRTYTAVRGQGCWLNGRRLAVRPGTDLARGHRHGVLLRRGHQGRPGGGPVPAAPAGRRHPPLRLGGARPGRRGQRPH